jgi:hypothetical protein
MRPNGLQTEVAFPFLYWMGDTLYGVKWRNFKMVLVLQRTLSDPALRLATPHLVNLDTDPKERNPYDPPFFHTWVLEHTARLLTDFQKSVIHEPLIPVGAPLEHVPKHVKRSAMPVEPYAGGFD